jgi:hypothetical protein
VIPPHSSGLDMSFLHIHLVRICNFSTYILCGYVIPPHTYISSGYVIPPHPPGPDMTFFHTHLVLICHSSTSI